MTQAQKIYNATADGQKEMCYNGLLEATKKSLEKVIATLLAERYNLVRNWREGGQLDSDWEKVEAHDAIMNVQEDAMYHLCRND